jgi:hypothetical protein
MEIEMTTGKPDPRLLKSASFAEAVSVAVLLKTGEKSPELIKRFHIALQQAVRDLRREQIVHDTYDARRDA